MEVRRVRQADLAALMDFWRKLRGQGPTPEDLSIKDSERSDPSIFENPFCVHESTSLICLEGGEIVGNLNLSDCPAWLHGNQVDCVWWQDFFVLPDERGEPQKGIGGPLAMVAQRVSNRHAVLGTPGPGSPVFQLYERLRWRYLGAVPFFFLILQPSRVLRQLEYLRKREVLGKAAKVGSYLLVPGLCIRWLHYIRGAWKVKNNLRETHVEQVREFDERADKLWHDCRSKYSNIFDRSSKYLNWRYKAPGYSRAMVHKGRENIGWFVYKCTKMRNDKYFGNLTVGTIVDTLVDPTSRENIAAALSQVVSQIREKDADLIVCNFSERRIATTARALGFLRGPSNYHFLAKGFDSNTLGNWHLTRGDSDGDGQL